MVAVQDKNHQGGISRAGRQFWPWIGIGDVVGAIRFALASPAISGPVNAVAPNETRCKDFTHTLGRVLGRPAFLPAPAVAVKLALGEMADAGAVAFSDDGRPVASSALMRHELEYSLALGRPIIDHCEDPGLAKGASMNEGWVATRLGLGGMDRKDERGDKGSERIAQDQDRKGIYQDRVYRVERSILDMVIPALVDE